jgi:hypothetical protein
MGATSKSPQKVLLTGYLIGKLALPDYSHKCSPKTYTQPQLFACLVLKEFLHRDYRGIEDLLNDTPELAAVIELKKVPDFTTLQKAAERLLVSQAASRLLDMTVRLGKFVGKLDTKAPLVAMDGTGLESRHASAYYVRRKAFDQAQRRLRFKTLAADAGYDAEHTHEYGRSRAACGH